MVEIKTNSADETVKVGKRLGTDLKRGDVVCLTGELGTGKTAFVGGVARALGIKGFITSPTFTIVNEYEGKIPLYHFDVYRLTDPDEMYEIGFEEYLSANGVVIIEWADLIRDILPDKCIWVDIKKDIGISLDNRIIRIDLQGKEHLGCLDKFYIDCTDPDKESE